MTEAISSPQRSAPSLPDFTDEGYQVTQELGHNRAGGRITYLATELNTQRSVVIKQFQFATGHNRWEDYEACQQEISILKTLDHPNIPQYLDSFQTPTGFCMVQEYKEAPSLAKIRPWTVGQVRQIAIAVLEILKYLQARIPPVIHRDLKPENILVDDQMTVYLVDFGFARLGGGQVAVSSVVKGTLGFMPPEQLFNRELTQASDLYSLGMTLVCLLTGVPSTEVGLLMNESGQVQIKQRLPRLSPDFLAWLEKMVQPQVEHRYPNAEDALHHLVQIQQLKIKPRWRWSWKPLAVAGLGLFAIALYGPMLAVVWQALETRLQGGRQPSPAAVDPSDVDPSDVEPQTQLTLTSSLTPNGQPTDSLQAVPTDGAWIAHTEVSNIANGNHTVACQLLDEAENAIDAFTREAVVLAEQQQLQIWCRYDLTRGIDGLGELPEGDRPHWFRLRLNDDPVLTQQLRPQ